jgi:hypothetical protein
MTVSNLTTFRRFLHHVPSSSVVRVNRTTQLGHNWTKLPSRHSNGSNDLTFQEIWGHESSFPVNPKNAFGKLDVQKGLIWIAKRIKGIFKDRTIQTEFAKTKPIYPNTVYSRIYLTAERQLFHLSEEFFHISTHQDSEKDLGKDLYPFLERIPGFARVKKLSGWDSSLNCESYIFKNEWWYKGNGNNYNLCYYPVEFLHNLKWKIVPPGKVQKGDRVIYFFDLTDKAAFPKNISSTNHFGRVVKVEGSEITIESKFGMLDVYHHKLELVPSGYGDSFLFMRKDGKVDPLNHQKGVFQAIWGNPEALPFDAIEKQKLDSVNSLFWVIEQLMKFETAESLIKMFPFSAPIIQAVQRGEKSIAFVPQKAYSHSLYARIQNTAERQLYQLSEYLYERKAFTFVWRFLSTEDIQEKEGFYAFASKIKGFYVYKLAKADKTQQCFDYIFKNAAWYSKDEAYRLARYSVSYLKEKGWEQIPLSDCKAGDVIFYFDDNELHMPTRYNPALHVGIVQAIQKGKIMIRSKFGSHDVMLHALEVVPATYGNCVLIMRKMLDK